jgi:hypothetical protein
VRRYGTTPSERRQAICAPRSCRTRQCWPHGKTSRQAPTLPSAGAPSSVNSRRANEDRRIQACVQAPLTAYSQVLLLSL